MVPGGIIRRRFKPNHKSKKQEHNQSFHFLQENTQG